MLTKTKIAAGNLKVHPYCVS